MADSNAARNRLNSMSAAQYRAARVQITSSPGFWRRNDHIPLAARQGIIMGIINNQWPQAPIFSPYAYTHDYYSKSKSQLLTKYS